MRRKLILLSALAAGALTYRFAVALGIPAWTTWTAGDACDCGLVAAILVGLSLTLLTQRQD